MFEGSSIEEFDTAEDLYESVGDMLMEVNTSKSEKEMMEICEELLRVTKM